MADHGDAERLLAKLEAFGPILAIKVYRLDLTTPPAAPVLPCLDHEAMLHEGIAPHVAAYVQSRATGDLHELVFIPAEHLIEVDTVSTWGECSEASHRQVLDMLASTYPEFRARVKGPSWWRGERRVAKACRAQVTLRDVLLGDDVNGVKARIDRLQLIGSIMEKQSRVASWGVRTVTGPLLTVAGLVTFVGLGSLQGRLGESSITALRYTLVGLLGAWFLYYGLKAVQLTEMSNRVWKRTAEYSLILTERRRIRENK